VSSGIAVEKRSSKNGATSGSFSVKLQVNPSKIKMGCSRIKERVNLLKLQNRCLGYFKAFFSGDKGSFGEG
jgi:hypothetical protein